MSSTRRGRLYALVDCDNFYVSCERVFQPHLKNRPVIVLSNNDGCIVARSSEVKALGIRMGTPFHQVKDVIEREHIKVLSSNYTLYGNMSQRVMEILGELAPFVEVYSIDEAFLLLETSDGKTYGERIGTTILRHTGIPVTVGIAPTKTLAKVAVKYAKQRGDADRVVDLASHPKPDSLLSKILVQDVWGIGIRIAEWLYERGVNTALDLKNINDETIRKRAGITGVRVVYELRGISCIDLRPLWAPRKGITSSRSFGRYVTSLDQLKESVATRVTRAAEKLREDGSVAGLLSTFITTNVYSKNPRYANTACVTVVPPSNATHELIRLALIAVERIYKSGFKYIKAGVTLTNITPASQRQLDIFTPRDIGWEERLYRAVDHINHKFGSKAVQHLACGINQGWAMRRDYRSQHYTSCWEELPVAKIS
ncbi:MAG: Y-family DNA polymerase [candidate division Zixibacteria bacterium]|nr:Y-family DNA polymerase [candidate division Zixibacteria bacterium]